MQVGSADATVGHLDDGFVGPGSAHGDGLHAQVVGGVRDDTG